MKHCELCKVDVDTNSEICPLCYNKLTELSEKTTPELFELKPREKEKKSRVIVGKIFLLLSIVAVFACGFVNYVTKSAPWSIVVFMGVIYLWVLVAHTIMSRSTPFQKIFLHLLSVVALFLTIKYVFNSNSWFVCYVFPSMSILVGVVFSFIVMCSKNRKKLVYSFFAIEILLMLASILLIAFGFDAFKLLNQINIFVLAIMVIAYLLFGHKAIKTEFVRKFHI